VSSRQICGCGWADYSQKYLRNVSFTVELSPCFLRVCGTVTSKDLELAHHACWSNKIVLPSGSDIAKLAGPGPQDSGKTLIFVDLKTWEVCKTVNIKPHSMPHGIA